MKEDKRAYVSTSDIKYIKGHKCNENKLFYIDPKEKEDQEFETTSDIKLKETTPTISCHALAEINSPQTLNVEAYIKQKKGNNVD